MNWYKNTHLKGTIMQVEFVQTTVLSQQLQHEVSDVCTTSLLDKLLFFFMVTLFVLNTSLAKSIEAAFRPHLCGRLTPKASS